MRVILEQLVEWKLAGETEVLGENLPQRHSVHHKIPHDDPVSNPGPQRWEASDYPLKLWRGLFLVPTKYRSQALPLELSCCISVVLNDVPAAIVYEDWWNCSYA
jgi:hypothetical protein